MALSFISATARFSPICDSDNKTAKQPYSQDAVDDDLQLTSYGYLLAANRYVFPTADVRCRFDVLRKLKKPKFEQHYTNRTAAQ